MRKSLSLLTIGALALFAPVTLADTIQLKNGSVIKGKVTSYSGENFIVMLDLGSGPSRSRAVIFIGDVEKIEFDAVAGSTDAAGATSSIAQRPAAARPDTETVARDPEPRRAEPESPKTEPEPRKAEPEEVKPTPPEKRDPQPEETKPAETETRPPAREPERAEPVKTEPEPQPAAREPEASKPPRKNSGLLRTATIDVVGKREWTSTGLIVNPGDRIRITGSGTVTLDPAGGQTSGPEGVELGDSKKLMLDRPTGALIAVIGSDNDDLIFIGRAAEFTATRRGLLFLSVNEGELSDNTGSFKAIVEVQAERTARQ